MSAGAPEHPATPGCREWDVESDGAVGAAEIPDSFALLRPYVAAFSELGRPLARFVVRDADRWISVMLRATDDGSATRRTTVSVSADVDAPGGYSRRELEIGTLIAAGLADKEIASRLGTSPRTVSTQISRLLTKRGLPTRSALAAVITAEGWLLLPTPGQPLRGGILAEFEIDARARGGHEPVPARPPVDLPALRRPMRAPLRIGLIVTGGAFADDGLEASRGAELGLRAMARMSRGAEGRALEPVKVVIDPLSSSSVAEGLARLASEDVDAILSTYASALDPRIFEFAADYAKPFLHTNSWTDSARRVEQEPGRFSHIFQTSPTELSYASGLRSYAERALVGHRLRTPHVSIIELDGFGCSLSAGNIHDELSAAGISVDATIGVGMTVDSPEGVARDALRTDPGLVIVSHLDVDVAIELHRAIRSVSANTPVFHLYTPSIPRFFRDLGEEADGVVWSTITGRTRDELGMRFSTGYRKEFGASPGWSQASAAYDQAQLLAQAFLLSGSRRAGDVSDALRHVVHRGVNGTYSLGSPSQTVAGHPFDSADPTLATPTITYRYDSGRMSVIR